MVDIHSHILPGLDDGSPNLEESLAMLRLAAGSGTTDIVATPHANLEFAFRPEAVEERISELAAACDGAPRIHPGCDFHLSYDNIQDALAHPAKYTINHKNYLLVEFSELVIFNTASDVLERLREAGMRPIVTHPERNWLLQQRIELLRSWVNNGCLMQVTAGSLLGRFGTRARDFSLELMRRGMAHVVASDAHDSKDRTPRLDEAFNCIARKFGAPRAEQLFVTNPQAILLGEPLEFPEVSEAPPARKWRLWPLF